jgi:hypothetical protein
VHIALFRLAAPKNIGFVEVNMGLHEAARHELSLELQNFGVCLKAGLDRKDFSPRMPISVMISGAPAKRTCFKIKSMRRSFAGPWLLSAAQHEAMRRRHGMTV